jgi:sec-independent protein translocase protein TatA
MAPSLWQLLIVLGIVILVFGTKKLSNMGGDIGSAIRNFKQSVKGGEDEAKANVEKLRAHTVDDEQSTQTKTSEHDKTRS